MNLVFFPVPAKASSSKSANVYTCISVHRMYLSATREEEFKLIDLRDIDLDVRLIRLDNLKGRRGLYKNLRFSGPGHTVCGKSRPSLSLLFGIIIRLDVLYAGFAPVSRERIDIKSEWSQL